MSIDSERLSSSIQRLLDDAIAKGVAPGLAATVFDQNDIVASATAGKASLNLDSHEELVKVLPELGKGFPGSYVWKIVDGVDENGEYRYREAKVGITLRHLLTHSMGSGFSFNSELGKRCHDEALKTGRTHLAGYIEAWNQPREFEAGEGFAQVYGLSAEWLGLFVQRIGGQSFRRSAEELVFKPLGLAPGTIETFRDAEMKARTAEIVAKLPDGTFISLPEPGFDVPNHKDEPPEGRSILANAPFWSSLRTFSQALRSLLNKTAPTRGGTGLISEELWQRATADDYAKRGISITQSPFMISCDPTVSCHLEKWSEVEGGKDQSLGFAMFQGVVHRSPNDVGFRPNVFEFSGLANTYYFLDFDRGIGAVITAQFFPWGDPAMIALKNGFFQMVFRAFEEEKRVNQK